MKQSIDFKKYTSIHIGPKIKVEVINEIGDYSKYTVVGRGNNLLVSATPPPLAILGEDFNYILQKNSKLIVGASTPSGRLLSYCKKNDIANFELLAKLPGNIGGLVKMNAGLKKWEIFDHLYSVNIDGDILLKDDIKYSYRYTKINGVIYDAVFNIEKGYNKELQKSFNLMRDNQPKLPSAGSCFKNPKEHSAGYLLEKVDMKGYTIGGMAFSSVHANFLVNLGGGTFDEAIKLIKKAKQKVKDKFDIELELEIVIL